MNKGRLEAFSDGVVAIAITIMVFDVKSPSGADAAALRAVAPALFSYLLSFVNLGIYWNNHHHLLSLARRVTGAVLWANLHLLFWLSLVPFTTNWMQTSGFAPWPTAVYGLDLLLSAVAWFILQMTLVRDPANEALRAALGKDGKGKASLALYLVAVPVALAAPRVAVLLHVAVALWWLVPDRRFESRAA